MKEAFTALKTFDEGSAKVAENLKKFQSIPPNLCTAECCRTCKHRVLLEDFDVFCTKHKVQKPRHMKCDDFARLPKGCENVEATEEAWAIINELQDHNAW